MCSCGCCEHCALSTVYIFICESAYPIYQIPRKKKPTGIIQFRLIFSTVFFSFFFLYKLELQSRVHDRSSQWVIYYFCCVYDSAILFLETKCWFRSIQIISCYLRYREFHAAADILFRWVVPAKNEQRVSISLLSFFFKRKCITHFFTKLIALSESSLVSTTNKLAENISSDTCNRLYYSEDKAPHESIQVYIVAGVGWMVCLRLLLSASTSFLF